MKKLMSLVSTTAVIMSMVASLSFAGTEDYGHIGAEGDDSYTLEEMLQYAIEDEYMAKYEYETLINDLGADRPFTNILKAEISHIEAVEGLYELYDLEIPAVDPSSMVVVPETIEEALAIGVEAEIANIAMYDLFLAEDLPDEVRVVFENLQAASESHLAAFEGSNGGQGNAGQGRSSSQNTQGNGQNTQGNVSGRGNGSAGRNASPVGSGYKVNGSQGYKNQTDDCLLD